MTFIKTPHIFRIFVVTLCLQLWITLPCVRAEESEDTVGLFSAWQEQSSTASRAPKPLSQTAENISVITSSEIEALNAHTLADVLATVPGIQTQSLGGPGSVTFTFVQGSSFSHSRILLDGAPLNNYESFADVGMVPARIIDRIEIVKGTASSSWGRALGGVINVITKRPDSRPIGGTVSDRGRTETADRTDAPASQANRLGQDRRPSPSTGR